MRRHQAVLRQVMMMMMVLMVVAVVRFQLAKTEVIAAVDRLVGELVLKAARLDHWRVVRQVLLLLMVLRRWLLEVTGQRRRARRGARGLLHGLKRVRRTRLLLLLE